jgi:hypothetical protein
MKTRDHRERTGLIGGFNPSQGIVSVLILALLVANLWSTWAGGPREAAAASPQAVAAASTGLRRFYLTPYWRYGNTALTACASGYHMASMWEILDSSNLEYNTDLGNYGGDSGQGPPAGGLKGWVRTGYSGRHDPLAGQANCDAWTSNSSAHYGTVVRLPDTWVNSGVDVHVWQVDVALCSSQLQPVWCVED